MKPIALVMAPLALSLVAIGSPNASEGPAADARSTSHVYSLPLSAGPGDDKQVKVLLDERHLKLATVVLRRGTVLPTHRAPVPTTILVLDGEGVVHLGDEAVPVSRGSMLALDANEDHDVVPSSGSEMILVVHYLKGASGAPKPSD